MAKTLEEKFLTKLDKLIAKAREDGVEKELVDAIESEAYRVVVEIN